MKRTIRKTAYLLLLTLSTSLLFGCGGGTSSSGAVTSYAGQYDGTLNVLVRGLGETLSQSYPYRVVVGVDGLVTAGNPNASVAGTCNWSPGPRFISGNSISASEQTTCSISGFGTCSVSAYQKIVFSNSAASTSGTFVFNCPDGRLDASLTGYLNKTG